MVISARAIASICCSPPESVRADWVRRSRSRGNRAWTRSIDQPDALVDGARAVASRFSSTLSDPKMRRPSGTSPMPMRAMRFGARPARSRPSSRMRPRRAGSSPMIVRTVVLLPMPLRPISETTSCAPTDSVMPDRTWLES